RDRNADERTDQAPVDERHDRQARQHRGEPGDPVQLPPARRRLLMGQHMTNRICIALATALLLAACSRSDADKELTATIEVAPAFDPGSMTEPPPLAEVTGN